MLIYRVISYLENLHGAAQGNKALCEHVAGIHSALKLWGDLYTHYSSEEEFKARLEELSEKRESCIVVMDCLKEPFFDIIRKNHGRCSTLVITDDGMNFDDAPPSLFTEVDHYLSLTHGHLSTTTLIAAIKKMTTKDLFGVEKYLTYGTPVHTFALCRSDDRSWFVENLTEYVSGLAGIIPSGAAEFARMSGDVLDEFLMNAVWDANPARKSVDRSAAVVLLPNEVVKVSWGVDGNTLAVSVTDPFGTFQRETLLRHAEDVLGIKKSKVKVNTSGPGAGIGLHMVLRRVSGLVINVSPGVATEFIALFDVTRSPRFLSKGPKTFHFFQA